MKSGASIEKALEDIGWGPYQTSLFINTTNAWSICQFWLMAMSILMSDYQGLDSFQKSMMPVSLNLGTIIGCYFFSYISDALGRKAAFQYSILVTASSALLLAFSPGYYSVLSCLVALGIGVGGDFAVPGTVLSEFIPPSKSKALTVMNVAWSIGGSICILLAIILEITWDLSISKWRALVAAGAVMSFVLWFMRLETLESPKYLQIRNEDPSEVLKEVARRNGKPYFEFNGPLMDDYEEGDITEMSRKSSSFSALFSVEMFLTTVLLTLQFVMVGFANTGFILFMPQLLPINSTLSSYGIILVQQICGMPAMLLAAYLADTKLGRRW
eukprot:CAMPEP_0202429172 /NCGR_PEP_ID=MMETSP1345-20130828/2997_1 /ASSEMBLY_ACC=CAM_ASM_000843 /TAXON_ID=342563 /ORGANISM="Fabrea Fabrea salina" /LENGTH=327 /DNA_ID=CAMNT_0049040337 /DNA_START=1 /DNA_END=981 /DNA_ORIENTATION=+